MPFLPESVLSVTDLGNGLTQFLFGTLSGGVFNIYHDAFPNASIPTGMGFDDGSLVAAGTIEGGQLISLLSNAATGVGIDGEGNLPEYIVNSNTASQYKIE